MKIGDRVKSDWWKVEGIVRGIQPCSGPGCTDESITLDEVGSSVRGYYHAKRFVEVSTTLNAIDSLFWMAGDEDGAVNLHCRACDLGGRPVVFLTSDPKDKSYEGTDTIAVNSIVDFVQAGLKHFDKHLSITLEERISR